MPNAALRFRPKPEQVRRADRAIVETQANGPSGADAGSSQPTPGHQRNKHYVWIAEGDLLAAVEIVVGRGDKTSTELVSGDLSEGQELVVGAQAAGGNAPSTTP